MALFVSWAVGMAFSYVLNFTWVFRPEEKLQFKARLAKYFAANLGSIPPQHADACISLVANRLRPLLGTMRPDPADRHLQLFHREILVIAKVG